MNRFVCHVQLYDGDWEKQVAESTVEQAVEACTRDDRVLRRLDFLATDSGDVLLAFKAEFETHWCHSEIVRDALIEALVQRLRPEYGSMVEVEVFDD